MPGYVDGKDKNTILGDMLVYSDVGSAVHEQQKMAIIVRCTEDLEKSMDLLRKSAESNAEASTKLGQRVFWLNIVVGAATIVGALATAFQAFK